MKPQEFFQAVRNTVPFAIVPSLLFLYSSPSTILIPPLKKVVVRVGRGGGGSFSLKELIPK